MSKEMKTKLLAWLKTATDDDVKKLDSLIDELQGD